MIDDHVPSEWKAGETSSSLLAGIQAQDPAAWSRFVALYKPLILHWCRLQSIQLADAEDVAQEVFQSVSGAVDRFQRQSVGSLRSWLKTITRNSIASHFRRGERAATGAGGTSALEAIHAVPSPAAGEEPPADAEDERIVIRQAFEMVLSGFKDHTREAFWRVVVDKQSPEHVAQDLGIGVHLVYIAKSRVLKRLREEFAGVVDLDSVLGSPLPESTEPPE